MTAAAQNKTFTEKFCECLLTYSQKTQINDFTFQSPQFAAQKTTWKINAQLLKLMLQAHNSYDLVTFFSTLVIINELQFQFISRYTHYFFVNLTKAY